LIGVHTLSAAIIGTINGFGIGKKLGAQQLMRIEIAPILRGKKRLGKAHLGLVFDNAKWCPICCYRRMQMLVFNIQLLKSRHAISSKKTIGARQFGAASGPLKSPLKRPLKNDP
jgi:hypothetical protein